jgi:hypothetical protein
MFTAFVIAAAITGGMLYGMNKVAETLQLRDPTRYFRVTDVIVPQPKGAAKRPQSAELPPPRAPVNYGGDGGRAARKSNSISIPPPRVQTRPGDLRPQIAPVIPDQSADEDKSAGQ